MRRDGAKAGQNSCTCLREDNCGSPAASLGSTSQEQHRYIQTSPKDHGKQQANKEIKCIPPGLLWMSAEKHRASGCYSKRIQSLRTNFLSGTGNSGYVFWGISDIILRKLRQLQLLLLSNKTVTPNGSKNSAQFYAVRKGESKN